MEVNTPTFAHPLSHKLKESTLKASLNDELEAAPKKEPSEDDVNEEDQLEIEETVLPPESKFNSVSHMQLHARTALLESSEDDVKADNLRKFFKIEMEINTPESPDNIQEAKMDKSFDIENKANETKVTVEVSSSEGLPSNVTDPPSRKNLEKLPLQRFGVTRRELFNLNKNSSFTSLMKTRMKKWLL